MDGTGGQYEYANMHYPAESSPRRAYTKNHVIGGPDMNNIFLSRAIRGYCDNIFDENSSYIISSSPLYVHMYKMNP